MVHAVTTGKTAGLSLAMRFLLLGVLAFGCKRLLLGAPRELRSLSVEVLPDASKSEIDRAIEEAMLLDIAERARLPQVDAVVRERVVRSLAVVEDVSDTNAAVARGVALGLHRQDVVARERLLADARELLLGDLPEDAATDEEARAFLAANAPLYALPARVQFKQLFLSRDKRGALLGRDAAEMKRRLAVADVASADAWAWTAPAGHYTEARLDAIAGPGFGALVMSAPVGVWTGPIESSFGLHFAWVTARTPASAAPLSVALPRARADLAVRAREQARKARLQQLREGYAVSWVRR